MDTKNNTRHDEGIERLSSEILKPLESEEPILAEENDTDNAETAKNRQYYLKEKDDQTIGIHFNEQKKREHDPELFRAQARRVRNLAKWYELGIRPSLSSSSLLNLAAHHPHDDDLFETEMDDLPTLLQRSITAQNELNSNLPPHPKTELEQKEGSLQVAPSTIEGAGNGLFATVPISKGTVVCHYAGYRHDYQSQKHIKDRQYVLKLQNGWPKFDRRNDGFVDAKPCLDVLARYINDPRVEERLNVKFEHIQEPGIWHCPVVALRDIAAGEELFVSYGPRYWHESRMVGG